jgi:fructokinase
LGTQPKLYAGIDAGGTTFKCGVATGSGEMIATHRVHVTSPEETLAACISFFRSVTEQSSEIEALGIASFGPVDISMSSPGYGSILQTPKPGWTGVRLRERFMTALDIPVAIDTDVNGALIAEQHMGAARNRNCSAYVTVGTGIGAGIWVNGDFAGRPLHPEFGHISVKKHSDDAHFHGVCPFHGDCLEGLASVPAIRTRWGEPLNLPPDHDAWEIIAGYLAQACRTLVLTLRPDVIILGGGLMLAPHLLARIRCAFDCQMADYLGAQSIAPSQLIFTPELGDDAGLIGAILMARKALSDM